MVQQVEAARIAQLAALFVRVFNAPPWDDGWSVEAAAERLGRLMAHPDFVGVSATDGSALVGFALGYTERWVRGSHFHLKEMCVDPAQQRGGIGGALLDGLVAELKGRGVDAVFLETRPGSPAASFYEKHGFKPLQLASFKLDLKAGETR